MNGEERCYDVIIGVSRHCLAGCEADADAAAIARGEGLDTVEFFGNDFTPEVMREIRRSAAGEGILVAWHPWLDLAGLGDAKETAACLCELVETAGLMGAGNMVLHLGEAPAAERESYLSALAEGFLTAVPAARQAGTRFCLENVPSYWGDVLGDRIADFEYIFSIVDDPAVGFTLDTGHAFLSGGCLNYIEALGSRLIYAHLHSNDGATDGHLGYPEGVLDWEGTLRAMMASGFRGPYNIEFDYDSGGRALRDLLRRLSRE